MGQIYKKKQLFFFVNFVKSKELNTTKLHSSSINYEYVLCLYQ